MPLSLDKVTELVHSLLKKNPYNDEEIILSLGDIIYYHIWCDLVVEARIEELQFVLGGHPKYTGHSIWLYLDPVQYGYSNGYVCIVPKLPLEKDELGWNIPEEIDPEEILLSSETVLHSWGAWIDLPIGHAVWPDQDIFTNLNEALQLVRPRKFRKRQRKSVLNSFIRKGKRFIASTHKKPVEQMNFPAYRTFKDRKVYWKRK